MRMLYVHLAVLLFIILYCLIFKASFKDANKQCLWHLEPNLISMDMNPHIQMITVDKNIWIIITKGRTTDAPQVSWNTSPTWKFSPWPGLEHSTLCEGLSDYSLTTYPLSKGDEVYEYCDESDEDNDDCDND